MPLDDPEKIGRIWIPDTAKQRIDQGVVVYKGPEVKDVKIGDHVFFGGYAGTRVSIEGEGTFIILVEDQCLAVLLSDDRDPILPLSEVLRIIEKGRGEALIKHSHPIDNTTTTIEVTADIIKGLFESLFFSEGMDF